MVDNWEIRNPPTQDGLGLSGHPLFSLLLPPASLLATPLCRGCSAAALVSSPSSPSLNADPHVCGSCPGFSRGCSALQDKGQYPPSLGTSCHGGSNRRPAPSVAFQQLPSGFPCVLGSWWCRRPGDSISILPESPCPCGGGGEAQPAVSAPWQPEGGTLCTQECVNSVKLHKQG